MNNSTKEALKKAWREKGTFPFWFRTDADGESHVWEISFRCFGANQIRAVMICRVDTWQGEVVYATVVRAL